MKIYYLTFRSVTFAQRGERLLSGAGIHCALQRTPKWMEEQGCGYALRVWTREIGQAVALLRQERVLLRKIYRHGPDGQLEEMSL